jgi:hypothetical protein
MRLLHLWLLTGITKFKFCITRINAESVPVYSREKDRKPMEFAWNLGIKINFALRWGFNLKDDLSIQTA